MKALLISVHPQWVELILNFIKKDEIRKGTDIGKAINRLIKLQGIAPTFIYCTKGKPNIAKNNETKTGLLDLNGKVVARFNATAEEITPFEEYESPFGMAYKLTKDKIVCCQKAQLTYDEYNNYLQGKKGTAIHINDLEIFDKPKEISEFKHLVKYWKCIDEPYSHYACVEELVPLTRAPESYCYIEI